MVGPFETKEVCKENPLSVTESFIEGSDMVSWMSITTMDAGVMLDCPTTVVAIQADDVFGQAKDVLALAVLTTNVAVALPVTPQVIDARPPLIVAAPLRLATSSVPLNVAAAGPGDSRRAPLRPVSDKPGDCASLINIVLVFPPPPPPPPPPPLNKLPAGASVTNKVPPTVQG